LRPREAPATAPRHPRTRTQRRQFSGRKTDRKSQHRKPPRNSAAASQQRAARARRSEKHHQPGICQSQNRTGASRQPYLKRGLGWAARPPLDGTAGAGKRQDLGHRRSWAGTHAARAERGEAAHQRRRDGAGDRRQQRRIGAGAAPDRKRSAAGGKIRRHPDHQRGTGRGKNPRTGQRHNAGQTKHPAPPAKKAQARPAKPRKRHDRRARRAAPP
jgi:hypothetical protein